MQEKISKILRMIVAQKYKELHDLLCSYSNNELQEIINYINKVQNFVINKAEFSDPKPQVYEMNFITKHFNSKIIKSILLNEITDEQLDIFYKVLIKNNYCNQDFITTLINKNFLLIANCNEFSQKRIEIINELIIQSLNNTSISNEEKKSLITNLFYKTTMQSNSTDYNTNTSALLNQNLLKNIIDFIDQLPENELNQAMFLVSNQIYQKNILINPEYKEKIANILVDCMRQSGAIDVDILKLKSSLIKEISSNQKLLNIFQNVHLDHLIKNINKYSKKYQYIDFAMQLKIQKNLNLKLQKFATQIKNNKIKLMKTEQILLYKNNTKLDALLENNTPNLYNGFPV